MPEDQFQMAITRIAIGIVDTVTRKNKDYGNSYSKMRSEWGPMSFGIRIGDKYNRLANLLKGADRLVIDETVEDTIRDIIGYCLLELHHKECEKRGVPNDKNNEKEHNGDHADNNNTVLPGAGSGVSSDLCERYREKESPKPDEHVRYDGIITDIEGAAIPGGSSPASGGCSAGIATGYFSMDSYGDRRDR